MFADYENDGKVGALSREPGRRGTLLENVSTDTGHWIEIKLVAQRAIATASARGSRSSPQANGRRRSAWRLQVISPKTTAACTLAWARQPPLTSSLFAGRAGTNKRWRNSRADRVLTVEETK